MPTNAEQLQAAYRLIREGRTPEAQQVLLPLVRGDAGNADAWWLLANAFGDTPKAVYALQQVLSLRPDDERAQRMLDRLRGAGITPQSPFDGVSSSSSSPVEFTPAQDTFSSSASSFGSGSSPVGGFGSASSPDPFGYSQASEKPKNDFNTYTPVAAAPPIYSAPPRRGSSPCVVVLAFIGALTLIACGLCAVITLSGGGAVGQFVQQAVGTMQADPDIATAIAMLSTQGVNFNLNGTPFSFGNTTFSSNRFPATLPTNVQREGEIAYGATETGTLSNNGYATYTFNGTAGDVVTITYNSTSNIPAFDPVLGLYNADNQKIAEDDDSGADRNSLIANFRLPSTGKYTILLGSFSSTGGDYLLSISTSGQ